MGNIRVILPPDPEVVDSHVLNLLMRHDDSRPQTVRKLWEQLKERDKFKVEIAEVAESLHRLEFAGLVEKVDITLYEVGYIHKRKR